MKKPVLIIMAAGMGSRYGGLKQMDPMDSQGHFLMDFSIYDAVRAGFEKIVFVIKRENEEVFRECVGDRTARKAQVAYAFQDLAALPAPFQVPEGRVKPWGTGHAVLCCKDVVDGPFAVINADDYYGPEAFRLVYDYLSSHPDNEKYQYAMVGYMLGNTLTENGYVSRGVCTVDSQGFLREIQERTRIEKLENGAGYTEDGGRTWTPLPEDAVVSMNLWGFRQSFMGELEKGFARFLETEARENPMKAEYYLPSAVSALLAGDKAAVKVLTCRERWYGVTYREDKQMVMDAVQDWKRRGLYPEEF